MTIFLGMQRFRPPNTVAEEPDVQDEHLKGNNICIFLLRFYNFNQNQYSFMMSYRTSLSFSEIVLLYTKGLIGEVEKDV